VKSHPRFHLQNLLYALAPAALARASSEKSRRPTGGSNRRVNRITGKSRETDKWFLSEKSFIKETGQLSR
jgi:hypothetical protein